MTVATVESFTDHIEELMPILPLHHAELAIDVEGASVERQVGVNPRDHLR